MKNKSSYLVLAILVAASLSVLALVVTKANADTIMTETPIVTPTSIQAVFCTADCKVMPVEVCSEAGMCTTINANYCNVDVDGECEFVFMEFLTCKN